MGSSCGRVPAMGRGPAGAEGARRGARGGEGPWGVEGGEGAGPGGAGAGGEGGREGEGQEGARPGGEGEEPGVGGGARREAWSPSGAGRGASRTSGQDPAARCLFPAALSLAQRGCSLRPETFLSAAPGRHLRPCRSGRVASSAGRGPSSRAGHSWSGAEAGGGGGVCVSALCTGRLPEGYPPPRDSQPVVGGLDIGFPKDPRLTVERSPIPSSRPQRPPQLNLR